MNGKVDIISAMRESCDMSLSHIPAFVFFSFLTLVISIASVGILAGPMFGGLLNVYLKLQEEETPRAELLFMPFDRFWTLCIFGLIMVALIVIPSLLGVTIIGFVLFIIIGTYWFYVLPLVVTQDTTIIEAMCQSKQLVCTNNYWLHIILFTFLVVISVLGAKAYWLGLLFTTPFVVGTIAACYATLKTDLEEVS